MATQGIVADLQPFVTSETPTQLKALVAKRIKFAKPHTYAGYRQALDTVISKLENLGVFTSEKSLSYALKDARINQGELSNQELINALFKQQRLQNIFNKINKEGGVDNLEQEEIEFLMQHPAENVQAFVNKYQQALEQALEMRFSEKVDTFLLKTAMEDC